MLISVREYATKMGKPKGTVNSAIQRGRLKTIKKRGRLYIEENTPWNVGKRTGISKDPLYNTWKTMIHRCHNPKYNSYQKYGFMGISVCDEWRDAKTFFDWMYSHGWKPGMSIDRIDPDGNYCPENCQVIDLHENTIKHRPPKYAEIERCKAMQWCKPRKKYAQDWKTSLLHTRFSRFSTTGFLREDYKILCKKCDVNYAEMSKELVNIPSPDDEYIRKYRAFGPSYQFFQS